jgi:hypothetical protein
MVDDCLFSINERSDFPLAVSFFDEDEVAVTPTAATYRVDDEQNKTNLQPITAFPTLDDSVDLWMESDWNRIIKPRSKWEVRTVTVEYDYESIDGPKHNTSQYRYRVMSLYGVVDVASPSISPSASASPSA